MDELHEMFLQPIENLEDTIELHNYMTNRILPDMKQAIQEQMERKRNVIKSGRLQTYKQVIDTLDKLYYKIIEYAELNDYIINRV